MKNCSGTQWGRSRSELGLIAILISCGLQYSSLSRSKLLCCPHRSDRSRLSWVCHYTQWLHVFFTAKMLVYKANGCYSAKLNNKLDALTDGIYAITPITVATAKSILLSQGCTVRVHPLSSKLPPPSLTPKFLHRNFSVVWTPCSGHFLHVVLVSFWFNTIVNCVRKHVHKKLL